MKNLRPRFGLRFSLRALCALVVLAAVFFAWLGHEVKVAREQRLAVEAILAYGGEVTFNGSTTLSQWDEETRGQLPSPTWWTQLFGEDPRLRVTQVRIYGRAGPNWAEFAKMASVVTAKDDFAIEEFTSRAILCFFNKAKARDERSASPSARDILGCMSKLRGLDHIKIDDPEITEEHRQTIREALPNVVIEVNRFIDGIF